MLEKIDIDELIKSPKEYLEELAKQYYEAHIDILNEAIRLGEKQSERILKVVET